MNELLISEGVDLAVKLATLWANATGAQTLISTIIANRIAAGGRDWTDAEREQVAQAVRDAKAYAIAQSELPDKG